MARVQLFYGRYLFFVAFVGLDTMAAIGSKQASETSISYAFFLQLRSEKPKAAASFPSEKSISVNFRAETFRTRTPCSADTYCAAIALLQPFGL
jgi:hypothetical protein